MASIMTFASSSSSSYAAGRAFFTVNLALLSTLPR